MQVHANLAGIPARLWMIVRLAERRLLMLDYDGTLAPFRVARDEARPLARSMELLREIAASSHTRVAIVSGRPLRELETLVDGLKVSLVGEHGWEMRSSDGAVQRRAPRPALKSALDAAERVARDAGWAGHLERKRSAIVLHTRGVPGSEAHALIEQCATAWAPLAADRRLALDRMDGGLELRARHPNKGTAVLALLDAAAPGTLGVFVGDDVTDEDAFQAVRARGFGVRVGSTARPSMSVGLLPSVDSVADFLEQWIRLTERGEDG